MQKDSTTHLHGYVKEGLTFAWGLSLENTADSYLCFWLALFHSVPYFFFLYWSPLSLCLVFYSVSYNIDEVLSVNQSANVFISGDFNVHLYRPGELCYNFSFYDLTQMVNFPT